MVFTCSLNGYENGTQLPLQGIQINIKGITEDMTVQSRSPLIQYDGEYSSRSSFNKRNMSIVLVYMVDRTGDEITYLPFGTQDLFQASVKLPDTEPEGGEWVFPVDYILIEKGGNSYKITDEVRVKTGNSGQELQSISIEWGAMEFEWSEKKWNPNKLRYEEEMWKDNGTGWVKVTNSGTDNVSGQILFSSERSEISGMIRHDGEKVSDEQPGLFRLAGNQSLTGHLQLNGRPSEPLNHSKIGNITLKIGE